MDALDINIASLLGGDGKLSNREIARRLGVAEGTVRQRLARLIGEGGFRVTAQADIESFPDVTLAIVGIKLDNRRLSDCAAEVQALPSVLTTMIVTGRYDLFAVILAQTRRMLVDFVTGQLARVEGVKDSETFVVLRNYGQWIAADRLLSVLAGDDADGGTGHDGPVAPGG